MKIFLTGSNGMVGRNILEHSRSQTFEWVTPSRDEIDLASYPQVETYLATHKPDLIIHAAAKVGGIQANIADPSGFLVQNLEINKNIIMAAHKVGIKKLLNLASSCIYPKDREEPLKEDLILSGRLEPTNEGYALGKIVGIKLCEYLSKQYPDRNYKTLIPCNLYGRWDKFDPSTSHLLPAIIHKLHIAKLNNDQSVKIWGDGTARREFLLASEFADCVINCIERFENIPHIMNVGLGYDYSVNEYYEAAKKIVGYRGSFEYDLTKPVGMKRKLVSIDNLRQFWTSEASLEDGILETYNFYKKYYNEINI